MAIVAALVACALIASWAAGTQTASAISGGARTHPGNSAAKVAPKTLPKARAAIKAPGVLVATSKLASLPIYPASGSPTSEAPASGARSSESLANPNGIGAPLVFLVHTVKPRWIQVYLPQRPNESLGWIPSSDVSLARDPDRIVVSLSGRRLEEPRSVPDHGGGRRPGFTDPDGNVLCDRGGEGDWPAGGVRALFARPVGLLEHLLLL
jgi:hypothetical protein